MEKKTILVGLVSFGRGCGTPNSPGVYARITAARDWIRLLTAVQIYILILQCEIVSQTKRNYLNFLCLNVGNSKFVYESKEKNYKKFNSKCYPFCYSLSKGIY